MAVLCARRICSPYNPQPVTIGRWLLRMASSDADAARRRLQELLSDDGQWKMYETWQAENPEYSMPPKWRQILLELAELRAKVQASTLDEPRGAEEETNAEGSPSTPAPSPSSTKKTQSPSTQTPSASATQSASPTRSGSPTSRTLFLDSSF